MDWDGSNYHFPAFLRAELYGRRYIWDRAAAALCLVRKSAPLWDCLWKHPHAQCFCTSYEGLSLETSAGHKSPEKNYLLKAIYLTNIDICFKFLSAVHYSTSSTDCPNSANNSFNTFFSQLLNSYLGKIFTIWQAHLSSKYFAPTFGVVVLHK